MGKFEDQTNLHLSVEEETTRTPIQELEASIVLPTSPSRNRFEYYFSG
jgi:hypothetical protein